MFLIMFYRTKVVIRPNISSGMLKCSIVWMDDVSSVAPVDIPNFIHIGTYITEIIGTVENDDPMPVVNSHPNLNFTKIVVNLLH